MNKVFLLRHGITQNNIDRITQPSDGGVELTQLGIDMCLAAIPDSLTELTSNGKPFVILSSTSVRAKQTANMYVESSEAIYETEDLLEVDFGDFAGKSQDWTHKNGMQLRSYNEWLTKGKHDFAYPNGEDVLSVRARVLRVIDKIQMLRKNYNVLVVGHNRIFRHLELEYRNKMVGEYYYEGMFGSEYPHGSLYDLDSNYQNDNDIQYSRQ